MYTNILVPTDGSVFAEKAIAHALDLALAIKAKVTGVTVLPPLRLMAVEGAMMTETPADYERWVQEVSEKRLGVIRKAAAEKGVPCDVVSIEHDQPYQGIIDAATQKGCDLIVMASHGRRGISAMLLGSEAQKVLTHSTIPVLIYR